MVCSLTPYGRSKAGRSLGVRGSCGVSGAVRGLTRSMERMDPGSPYPGWDLKTPILRVWNLVPRN